MTAEQQLPVGSEKENWNWSPDYFRITWRLLYLLQGLLQQARTRFLNRGPVTQQSVKKNQHIVLDQDPDQEVVTTTKSEVPQLHLSCLMVYILINSNQFFFFIHCYTHKNVENIFLSC